VGALIQPRVLLAYGSAAKWPYEVTGGLADSNKARVEFKLMHF